MNMIVSFLNVLRKFLPVYLAYSGLERTFGAEKISWAAMSMFGLVSIFGYFIPYAQYFTDEWTLALIIDIIHWRSIASMYVMLPMIITMAMTMPMMGFTVPMMMVIGGRILMTLCSLYTVYDYLRITQKNASENAKLNAKKIRIMYLTASVVWLADVVCEYNQYAFTLHWLWYIMISISLYCTVLHKYYAKYNRDVNEHSNDVNKEDNKEIDVNGEAIDDDDDDDVNSKAIDDDVNGEAIDDDDKKLK